jgi:hypothetical protein
MNEAHREFFIKLRRLCDEYRVTISVTDEPKLLFTVRGKGNDGELYRAEEISCGSSMHLSWTEHESLHPSKEPKP